MKPAHYRGRYHVESRRVRRLAYADPETRCGRCGETLHHWSPDDRWEAGHVVDGQVNGSLRPEHRSCNRRAGAERAKAKRLHVTARW